MNSTETETTASTMGAIPGTQKENHGPLLRAAPRPDSRSTRTTTNNVFPCVSWDEDLIL